MTTTRRLQIIIDQGGDASGGLDDLIDKLGSGTQAATAIAIGALGAVTAAVIGIGAAAIDAWSQMDEGVDNFTNKTGITGDALDDIQKSIEALSESSAGAGQGLGDIGDVLGEVSKRTGATGKDLEILAGKMLKINRVTGVDGVKATQLVTRAMGDWGVEMEDSSELIDKLLTASQKSGVGFDDLAAKVVQFGAPLRQMGFSLDESIALFAKWEQEGVNAELVMGSLRIAAGNFARDNIPLRDGLLETMAAIQGAASESEGLAIAMDVFGARAGPDMAAAIREGRFSIEEMIAALEQSGGALDRSADATLDFADRASLQFQRAQNALVPLGQVIMDFGDQYVMPGLTRAVDMFTGWAGRVEAAYSANGLRGVELLLRGDLILLSNAVWEWIGETAATFPGKFNAFKYSVIGQFVLLWTEAETATAAALGNWATSLNQAVITNKPAIVEAGKSAGDAFIAAVTELFSSPEKEAQLGEGFVKAINAASASAGATAATAILAFGEGLLSSLAGAFSSDKTFSENLQTLVSTGLTKAADFFNPQFELTGTGLIGAMTGGVRGSTPLFVRALDDGILTGQRGAMGQANAAFPAVGEAADRGIEQGIERGIGGIERAARRAARRAYDAAMDELDAQSPSRLFADKVGEQAMAGGIVLGLDRGGAAVAGAARSMVTGAASGLSGSSVGNAGPITVQVFYSPLISTADEIEVETRLIPLIREKLRL